MRLFDTDVMVDIVRGHPPALQWFNALTEPASAAGLAYMEVISGCKDRPEVIRVQQLLSPLSIAWGTEEDGEQALAHFLRYRLSHNLGLLDSLIAATALRLGATLCTFNVKHFMPIPGLVLEQPYTR